VSWPQEYGGRGATVLEQLAYAEETIHARAPVPLNVIGMNNIAPAIMQYGTDAQKRELLPRMVRADDIWCQGMSEPEAGLISPSLRTRAVWTATSTSSTARRSGHRWDIARIGVSSMCAPTPDASKHKGISCLIVDMALPGLEARPLVTLNGDADFAEVFFDDVRVPADALLGPLKGGWQVATTTLSHERAGAARLYAQLEVQLRDLVADLADCEVDGRPVLEDTATLRRLGEVAVRIKYLEVALPTGDLGDASRRRRARVRQPREERVGGGRPGAGHAGVRRAGPAKWAPTVVGSSTDVALPDHRGRHDQINKSVTATRVLGLPRR